jgi:glycolate oxidase
MVTEVTVRLSPQLDHSATVLAPFASVDEVTAVVPEIVGSGLQPSILEYLDVLTMASVTRAAELELGVPGAVAERTLAYLVILLETRTREQLDGDLEALAGILEKAGSIDTFVLPELAGRSLIEARERAFWVAKAAGAHDIIDIVVPRSKVPAFMAEAQAVAQRHGTFVGGCGHVGDGNVHLSFFLPGEDERRALLAELFAVGHAMGGQVSGEHGVGRDKQEFFLALTNPVSLALQRAIKQVFDPAGLLNPHRLLDERPLP